MARAIDHDDDYLAPCPCDSGLTIQACTACAEAWEPEWADI